MTNQPIKNDKEIAGNKSVAPVAPTNKAAASDNSETGNACVPGNKASDKSQEKTQDKGRAA